MEPRQQGLSGGQERSPASGGEFGASTPEFTVGELGERGLERPSEVNSAQTEVAQIAMPTLPAPVLATQQASSAVGADDDVPVVAGDDDLIEKEWVDKAKKIIAETRDDPYRREREISKLQIEYIRRRYGREIGDSGER